jgi:hypothetical protein
VALLLASGETIAIESKFTEWMTPKSPGKDAFRSAYFPQSEGVWARVGLTRCQQLVAAVAAGREQFRWLDVPQLLKHALGLATSIPGRFSLSYFFFDACGNDGHAHQEEIDRFASLAGAEIGFVARSYQALFGEMVKHVGAANADYVAYLANRYFSR